MGMRQNILTILCSIHAFPISLVLQIPQPNTESLKPVMVLLFTTVLSSCFEFLTLDD